MKAFILDASTALGWMLDRPAPSEASNARKHILVGATPVVPTLWLHEISNAIVMAERRGRLTANEVKTLTSDLEQFTHFIKDDSTPLHPSVLIEMPQRSGLTVYDSTYLEVAYPQRLSLATLDVKLREAAQRSGLMLV